MADTAQSTETISRLVQLKCDREDTLGFYICRVKQDHVPQQKKQNTVGAWCSVMKIDEHSFMVYALSGFDFAMKKYYVNEIDLHFCAVFELLVVGCYRELYGEGPNVHNSQLATNFQEKIEVDGILFLMEHSISLQWIEAARQHSGCFLWKQRLAI